MNNKELRCCAPISDGVSGRRSDAAEHQLGIDELLVKFRRIRNANLAFNHDRTRELLRACLAYLGDDRLTAEAMETIATVPYGRRVQALFPTPTNGGGQSPS